MWRDWYEGWDGDMDRWNTCVLKLVGERAHTLRILSSSQWGRENIKNIMFWFLQLLGIADWNKRECTVEDTRGVVVIVAANGHSDPSSNPERMYLYFILC